MPSSYSERLAHGGVSDESFWSGDVLSTITNSEEMERLDVTMPELPNERNAPEVTAFPVSFEAHQRAWANESQSDLSWSNVQRYLMSMRPELISGEVPGSLHPGQRLKTWIAPSDVGESSPPLDMENTDEYTSQLMASSAGWSISHSMAPESVTAFPGLGFASEFCSTLINSVLPLVPEHRFSARFVRYANCSGLPEPVCSRKPKDTTVSECHATENTFCEDNLVPEVKQEGPDQPSLLDSLKKTPEQQSGNLTKTSREDVKSTHSGSLEVVSAKDIMLTPSSVTYNDLCSFGHLVWDVLRRCKFPKHRARHVSQIESMLEAASELSASVTRIARRVAIADVSVARRRYERGKEHLTGSLFHMVDALNEVEELSVNAETSEMERRHQSWKFFAATLDDIEEPVRQPDLSHMRQAISAVTEKLVSYKKMFDKFDSGVQVNSFELPLPRLHPWLEQQCHPKGEDARPNFHTSYLVNVSTCSLAPEYVTQIDDQTLEPRNAIKNQGGIEHVFQSASLHSDDSAETANTPDLTFSHSSSGSLALPNFRKLQEKENSAGVVELSFVTKLARAVYRKWLHEQRQHLVCENPAVDGGDGRQGNSDTGVVNQSSIHSSSRSRNQNGVNKRGREYEDENEDDDRGKRRGNPRDPKLRPTAIGYSTKNNREKQYRTCSGKYLTKIARVKQHLQRVHARPEHYCGRCYAGFKEQSDLDDHSRQLAQCQISPRQYCERMSDRQAIEIKKKRPKQTPEENWYLIWDTLFPDTPRPKNPYMEEDETQDFLDFCKHEIPAELPEPVRRLVLDTLRDMKTLWDVRCIEDVNNISTSSSKLGDPPQNFEFDWDSSSDQEDSVEGVMTVLESSFLDFDAQSRFPLSDQIPAIQGIEMPLQGTHMDDDIIFQTDTSLHFLENEQGAILEERRGGFPGYTLPLQQGLRDTRKNHGREPTNRIWSWHEEPEAE